MKERAIYWMEHCVVPHGGQDIRSQWQAMFHDRYFGMAVAALMLAIFAMSCLLLLSLFAPALGLGNIGNLFRVMNPYI